MLTVAIGAWLLSASSPANHYRLLQEDGLIEWATVWCLIAASFCFGVIAFRARGLERVFPVAMVLFCLAVAGEEISWGQRLFGVQPPVYFLAHNDQQELNLHNVLPKDLRQFGLQGALLGYGVVLPLLGLIRPARSRLQSLGVGTHNAMGLIPGFAFASVLYAIYPVRFTGEWVELMLGVGLAGDGLLRMARGRPMWRAALPAMAMVALLALVFSGWSRSGNAGDTQAAIAAETELESLRQDFRVGRVQTRCGQHKRIYRILSRRRGSSLEGGRFRGLVSKGLAAERAEFVLDPWSSPYWVRDTCSSEGGRRIVVYSLGPNRVRDSIPGQPGGDDLVLVVAEGSPGPQSVSSPPRLGAKR
ncbi:MAG: hypothetical protein GY723_21445 [bacterium]|nr:hypothetical protein [bacterium]